MPIISKFPVWVSPWALDIQEKNYHETFPPKDNFCCADSVLWDKKTGVLLNSGNGIKIMMGQDLKRLQDDNSWVWLAGETPTQTAYFAVGVKVTMRLKVVEYTKIATIVPR